jgi:very-short-patch-repair endonuclease
MTINHETIQKQCDKCNKEFSLSNFNKHYNACVGETKKHSKINEEWKQINSMYKCPICGKEYTKKGISSHIIFKHYKNKENGFKSGFTNYNEKVKNGEIKHWAKDLTKETSKIIKNISNTKIEKYKSGELICPFKGKKHTIKSKDKMRKSALNAFQKGIHSTWKTRNIKSYPELYFEAVLKDQNIFEQCIVEHYIKPYFLDFYFPEKQINLEIDGGQHKYRQESDKRRDKYLTSLGIKVFRIDWRNPKTTEGKEYINNKIKEFLKFIK